MTNGWGSQHGGTTETQVPLTVLLFHAAMERDQALSDFADDIGVGALSLRQYVTGKTRRPRGRTLELMADALEISVEEAQRHMLVPLHKKQRFNEWLQTQMKERNGQISRAQLHRATSISDGALRNYLTGQTLPDTNQARRLAEALGASTLEMAEVIVADQFVRAGNTPAEPPTETQRDVPTGSAIEGTARTPPMSAAVVPESVPVPPVQQPEAPLPGATATPDEAHLLSLWRQLHPHGRRATLTYIASLLAEG